MEESKEVTIGVRVVHLDSYAYCDIFINNKAVNSGYLVLRKDQLPTLLFRLGVEQAGDILFDTSLDIKQKIHDIFEGYDPDVDYELRDFGGWKPLTK